MMATTMLSPTCGGQGRYTSARAISVVSFLGGIVLAWVSFAFFATVTCYLYTPDMDCRMGGLNAHPYPVRACLLILRALLNACIDLYPRSTVPLKGLLFRLALERTRNATV